MEHWNGYAFLQRYVCVYAFSDQRNFTSISLLTHCSTILLDFIRFRQINLRFIYSFIFRLTAQSRRVRQLRALRKLENGYVRVSINLQLQMKGSVQHGRLPCGKSTASNSESVSKYEAYTHWLVFSLLDKSAFARNCLIFLLQTDPQLATTIDLSI